MGSENVNERMATDSTGKSDVLKKFSNKKWGIVGAIAVVLIALIVGISIYNTPANRLARQLDLGNRYLEEQNYEQAIVEFDKAIAIDPMYVEAYLGKAEAYEGLDDFASVVETLQAGYKLTNDERLKEKLDKVYIELPFDIADFKIMGYDLLEPHLDEVGEAFGCPKGGWADTTYGQMYRSDHGFGYDFFRVDFPLNTLGYGIFLNIRADGVELQPRSDGDIVRLELHGGSDDNSYLNVMESFLDVPVYPRDTYETWCEKMGIDIIKNSMEGYHYGIGMDNDNGHDTTYGDGSTLVKNNNNFYRIFYREDFGYYGAETSADDYDTVICTIYMENCDRGFDYKISAGFELKRGEYRNRNNVVVYETTDEGPERVRLYYNK